MGIKLNKLEKKSILYFNEAARKGQLYGLIPFK